MRGRAARPYGQAETGVIGLGVAVQLLPQRLAAELGQGTSNAHKGLPGQVVGAGLVAPADAAVQLAQTALVGLHQRGKSAAVADGRAGHQRGLLRGLSGALLLGC